MMVFHSLVEALKAGYQVEQSIHNGYIVRIRTESGYARAIVELSK